MDLGHYLIFFFRCCLLVQQDTLDFFFCHGCITSATSAVRRRWHLVDLLRFVRLRCVAISTLKKSGMSLQVAILGARRLWLGLVAGLMARLQVKRWVWCLVWILFVVIVSVTHVAATNGGDKCSGDKCSGECNDKYGCCGGCLWRVLCGAWQAKPIIIIIINRLLHG